MLTEITDLPDTDLIDAIHTTHHTLTRHQARFIVSLAEFHDRNLAKKHGAPNTVTWLMRHHDLARRTAYEYLGIGTKLRAFHQVTAEFLTGRLSYSKIRLLLRYLTHSNEDELVELALQHCLTELEQALAGRPRSGGKKARGNCLRVVIDEDTGGLNFWGSLDADHGAEFLAALKTGELAYLRDLTNIDPEVLNNPEALDAEITTARQDTEQQITSEQMTGQDGTDTAGDQKDGARTRFGAPLSTSLLSAFLAVINMVRTHPVSTVRAPGAQVNVLVTLDGRVVIPDRFGAETAALLRSILNGDIRYHLLDNNGLHLKLSRSARLASPALEKALLTRWGYRCATPGCCHSRFLEFHHITDWASGGTTDLDNLIPLCSGCHALVTAGKMTIHADEINPQLLRFRLPGGQSHTSTARELPVRNEQMGIWADDYTDGPVPRGDEHHRQVWDSTDSFDDPDTDNGRGTG